MFTFKKKGEEVKYIGGDNPMNGGSIILYDTGWALHISNKYENATVVSFRKCGVYHVSNKELMPLSQATLNKPINNIQKTALEGAKEEFKTEETEMLTATYKSKIRELKEEVTSQEPNQKRIKELQEVLEVSDEELLEL
jgi:hypothetical protein